jgi:hypothetical protein
LDFQSYKTAGGKSTVVQVTKIIAITGIIIAGMISVALVFSAWLTSSNQICQLPQQSQQTVSQLVLRDVTGQFLEIK